MHPFTVYDWDPLPCKTSALTDLMRKNRGQNLLVRFFYEDYVYDAGVHTENGSSVFYLDDDSYPSMLGFCSGACIEGVLISDFSDVVQVLSVNEKDPREFLA
ncbi:MAG: hypothetical protein IJ512_01335 [Ruminococcus sp.]|nr:hypothetical protein [Ruminococcus sp.]